MAGLRTGRRPVRCLALHPAGSLFRGSDGETDGECEVGQGNRDAALPVVSLIPADRWWIATWYANSADRRITVDICTPATLIDGEWTYIDLKLDPHRTRDGRVGIADEDEFLDACNAGTISGGEQVAAREATTDVERLLRHRAEPFGSVGWRWLRHAMAMPLPPLTELD
jgi:hypothetical protein